LIGSCTNGEWGEFPADEHILVRLKTGTAQASAAHAEKVVGPIAIFEDGQVAHSRHLSLSNIVSA
jgi:hypothetical protein